MSTIPISSSAPPAAQTGATAGSSSASSAQGNPGFNQALVQVMGAEQNAAVAPDLAISPLQMLAGNGGGLEEGAGKELLDILPDLIQDPDQLDDLLESNPELLSALQAWLAEVQQFLNGTKGSSDGSSDIGTTAGLAENPATIRFALQDSLAQLLDASAADKDKAQVTKLLQSLQSVIDPTQTSKNGAAQSLAADASDSVPLFQQKIQQAGQQTGQSGDGGNGNAQAGQANDAAVSGPADTASDNFPVNTVTTAGQLTLQNNGTAPALHERPVVHMRHFAKEMTEFVVQKLDIIKQNGMSEATIMLRPEHLGQLEVKLSMSNGQLVAQFMTEHGGAKDLLEQQMSHLRASLHNQGIQVNKVEVTHNESLSSHLYQQGQGSGANQQQQERRSRTRGKEDNEDALKAAEMAEELRTWTKEQRLDGIGQSSFTAQA
ncbi:flagellar hook-length control protein FliK [Paenibacillus jiagnxiensis]|uniref:flagellar hook-length control protein FliK n=1 Tax=Paenibacillus jiagnxiensis TaxID=3228926 RepID=UPI0033B5A2D2